MVFQTSLLENKFFPAVSRSAGSKPAILILVHGRGGRRELMEWAAKKFKIPGLDYLSIQAPYPENVPQMKQPGFSWIAPNQPETILKTRELISKLIEEIHAAGYPYDRIFWMGFSQGAATGMSLFLRSDVPLGGLFAISGLIFEAKKYPEEFGKAISKQRIVMTHGMRDQIVPFDRVKKDAERLKSVGAPVEFIEYDKPHSFDAKKEIPELQERLRTWLN